MPTPTSSLAPAPLSHTDTDPALPFPQPSQSYLTDFTIADISCPSSGKRHVGSGLCPEIKQYAVTGKKQKTKQNYTQQQTVHTHTHTFTHGRPVVTPRQKRQTMATESLHFHVASQFMEPYGLFVVDNHNINNHDLLMWKPNLQLLSFSSPRPFCC